jgi:type 2 lantibiotic biosynthesis protein LanM
MAISLREGVATALGPWMERGLAHVRTAWAACGAQVDGARAWPSLRDMLADRLVAHCARVLALELAAARLQGPLDDVGPGDRRCAFFTRLAEPARRSALFDEYPLLLERIDGAVDDWARFVARFLAHLKDDPSRLAAGMPGHRHDDRLVDIAAPGGDPHAGGSVVLVLRYESGRRIVYKPRPGALDVHFSALLRWIEARAPGWSFRTPHTLHAGDHSWSEFIEARPCREPAELARFYRHQGRLLAILHAIDAADLHFENIVAAGEHPVLVDLEALFHPDLAGQPGPHPRDIETRAMRDSVLRLGLLPWRLRARADGPLMDVGGLSAPAGQMSATPVLVPEWQGDLDLRFVRRHVPIGGAGHLPTGAGRPSPAGDHVDEIAAGFDEAYRLLLRERTALRAPDGPIHAFADDAIRVVLRPSQFYFDLLEASRHPDFLRCAASRDVLWKRLDQAAPGAGPADGRIEAERQSLERGDIPLFHVQAATRDLLAGPRTLVRGFLAEAPLDRVLRRIGDLGEDDLARQQWVVRASLATLARPGATPSVAPAAARARAPRARPAAAERAASATPLDLAWRAARTLQRQAFLDDGQATWLDRVAGTDGRTDVLPLGTDVYDGLPGVILFLAQVDRLRPGHGLRTLAEAALRTWLAAERASSHQDRTIGAFVGWGGSLYVLAHLASLWQRADLLSEAEARLDALPRLIEADVSFDLVSGSAGCLMALLSLHHAGRSPRSLELATACGERLLRTAQPQDVGVAWSTGRTTAPLGGLSHGVSGMAMALLALERTTGSRRFRQVATQALAYERSLFDPARGNWRDLRAPPARRHGRLEWRCSGHWCHGAPGIGMARLSTLDILDDTGTREDIEAALRVGLRRAPTDGHGLCHGALGNLEIGLQARLQGLGPHHAQAVRRQAAGVLHEIDVSSGGSGPGDGVASLGLMAGLAGIGFGLLRLADPQGVPSVLLLEPPRARGPRDGT